MTHAEDPMDVDDDNFDFTFGCSSSCPPPEESTHHPPSPLPPAPPAPNLATGACPGVLINWNIEAGSAGWTFPWHRLVTNKDSELRKLRTKLLSAGLRNGAGPQKLINLLGDVISGVVKYNPRPSTESRTVDISLMAYILGGRKLYALSHGCGLPSLCTLRRHMAFTCVMPTIGIISISDILHNIEEVVFKPRAAAGRTKLRGVNLSIDETALEQCAVHFCHNNQVGALKLSEDIKKGTAHLVNELTVVAASCFGEGGTYPILALPSCKGVNADDSQNIYETVIEAWEKSGAAAKVGNIWSWSTDGAMPCRIAGYRMAGLNLYTGVNQITLDFNYKHIFKSMLARYLTGLPQHSPESVHKMLYPHDPQDIPRAIELLEAVVAIGKLDYGNMDVNTCADVDALRLLGSVINAILEPFTNVHMNLKEQITSLSIFAHLSFTLSESPAPNICLISYTVTAKTMVKNTIFCLAKQQILDPTQPFYLFQVGDDPLECLFGKLRMLGGHNTAMSYSQAIDRLGHVSDLQGTFMRNPDLDQSERHLNMSRSEGVDCLSMGSFTGDLIAGSCHLPSAWADGCDKAISLFKKSAVAPQEYDYLNIFLDSKTNMLAPFGNGLYPGVDFDKNIPDHSEIIEQIAATPSSNVDVPEVDSDSDDKGDGANLEEVIDTETVPELELPSGPGITPATISPSMANGSISKGSAVLSSTRASSPVRLFSCCASAAMPMSTPNHVTTHILIPMHFLGKTPSLLVTPCSCFFAPIQKSLLLFSEPPLSIKTTIKNPVAKVKITGQVYSLIRKTAAPDVPGPIRTSATIRSKDWLESDEEESDWAWIWNSEYLKVDSVMKGTLGSDKVTTDKVVLVSVPGVLTELVNPVMVDASIRLGEQMAFHINSLGQSWEIDDRQLGLVAELLWGSAMDNNIAAKSITAVSTSPTFPYVFDDGNPALLSAIPTQQLIHEHGEHVNRVCELCGEKAENQRAHMGMHVLRKLRGIEEKLVKPASSIFFANTAHMMPIEWIELDTFSYQKRQRALPLHHESYNSLEGRTYSFPALEVGDLLPCGFCGESGHTACNVYLHVKTKAATVEANCCLITPMRYAFAERGSQATPCRNVPIICGLCPSTLTAGKESCAQPAQWRYNMEEHLAQAHPEYASPRNPEGDKRLPHVVWIGMKTSKEEERALGIPVDKIPVTFSRIAGLDEGVEEPQLGVCRVLVCMAPVGQTRPVPSGASGRAKKKQKMSSGTAAVASGSGKK
ncbi:hypothetical protein B0H14DRAFT_3741875 [Mycena olivaceomarginata]|nr:hypothetical protein B0H14DRAFT_3741875 [Mycena olivaceomarginata]